MCKTKLEEEINDSFERILHSHAQSSRKTKMQIPVTVFVMQHYVCEQIKEDGPPLIHVHTYTLAAL